LDPSVSLDKENPWMNEFLVHSAFYGYLEKVKSLCKYYFVNIEKHFLFPLKRINSEGRTVASLSPAIFRRLHRSTREFKLKKEDSFGFRFEDIPELLLNFIVEGVTSISIDTAVEDFQPLSMQYASRKLLLKEADSQFIDLIPLMWKNVSSRSVISKGCKYLSLFCLV